jgi:hypothetical protein
VFSIPSLAESKSYYVSRFLVFLMAFLCFLWRRNLLYENKLSKTVANYGSAFTEQNQSYNRTHSIPVTVTQRLADGRLIRAIFGRKQVDLHVFKHVNWSPDFVLLYVSCFKVYRVTHIFILSHLKTFSEKCRK